MKVFSALVLLVLVFADDPSDDQKLSCNDYFEKFWNATRLDNNSSYLASSCCNHFAFVEKQKPSIEKCDLECMKDGNYSNEAYCCSIICFFREENIYLDGQFHQEGIKKQCMASVSSDSELAEKYEPIVDESLLKCVSACEFKFQL